MRVRGAVDAHGHRRKQQVVLGVQWWSERALRDGLLVWRDLDGTAASTARGAVGGAGW